MKCTIGRQIPNSSLRQQGASDPSSALSGLCVYLFYPNLFPYQINIISYPPPPQIKKQQQQQQPECPLKVSK